MLKLNYAVTARKKIREFIYQRRSFVCTWRLLNLYLLMFQEIIMSCFLKSFKDFYNKHKEIPERELAYLLQNYDLNNINKVIIVGAGAIPYTAIFFAKQINKTVYVIEKNGLASFACLNLLRRLNINNIKVINSLGQFYNGYVNSLAIICLHTTSKQKILERVLSYSNYNNIIVIRQPLTEYLLLYESVSLNGLKYKTIKHSQNLESMVLFGLHPFNWTPK